MKTTFLIGLVTLGLTSLAFANTETEIFPQLELGVGYEVEGIGVTVPQQNNAPSIPSRAQDDARSGARLTITFEAVKLNFFSDEYGTGRITFLPIHFVGDPQNMTERDGFGRVVNMPGNSTAVRKVIGVLVEGNWNPDNGHLFLRGKLASVEFDRDKGIWDWRLLEAGLGVQDVIQLADGTWTVHLQAAVTGAFGGVTLNNFDDLERALGIVSVSATSLTFDPTLVGRAALSNDRIRVELAMDAGRRYDVSWGSQGQYLGREPDTTSTRMTTSLTGEYKLPVKSAPSRYSAFLRVSHDYDTLTIGQVMFNSGDAFQAFTVLAGVRGRM